jgi:hypothetical protein
MENYSNVFCIKPGQRFVGESFASQNGKLKFNFEVFNTRNNDYQNQCINMKFIYMNQLYKNNSWRRYSFYFILIALIIRRKCVLKKIE